MIRSNNPPQSGYIKLQESDIYEDEDWSDIFPNKAQRRSLSDSRHSRVEFQIPRNRMEAASHESEHSNTGNSNDHNSYNSHRTDRSSAWSQISKKLKRKKGKELNKAELEIYESVFKPIPTLQDLKVL
jgi:hypothetical protein